MSMVRSGSASSKSHQRMPPTETVLPNDCVDQDSRWTHTQQPCTSKKRHLQALKLKINDM
jgi:hypothetical protein